ncbi:unnamed protein product [Cylindrotheca closterium]|uniref:Hexosyltransferase n=1 Tax=Cylindrotheca closterium TaxID=2856 RepID=A0AAD2PU84_9STRA|nr:unnamed protein product [Cylindrotheca closterium]
MTSSSRHNLISGNERMLQKDQGLIFIAVVSSRETLASRVKYVRQSWAAQSYPIIVVRYFVGDGIESKVELAQQAGMQDPSDLVIMSGLADNEYPPVYKNTRMLRYALHTMIQLEKDHIIWDFKYFMKVDDDTFVNTPALMAFLQNEEVLGNTQEPSIWGRRGYGLPEQRQDLRSAGIDRPYCMGGPGYIMTRDVLGRLATGVRGCVQNLRKSEYKGVLWHSDVIIGLCAKRLSGAYCKGNGNRTQGGSEKHNGSFIQITGRYQLSNILMYGDLQQIVALHPFKDGEQMFFLQNSLDRRRSIDTNGAQMKQY